MMHVVDGLAVSILTKATVIVAVGLAGACLARGSRAAVRHAVLAASFAVMLVLPFVSMVVPPVRVAVPVAPAVFAGTMDAGPQIASSSVRVVEVPSVSRWTWPSAGALLLAEWFTGVVLFLLRMVVGLRQVHSLRRFGLPWRDGQVAVDRLASDAGIRRRVDVLVHESLPAPVTCGVVHPAIVLPPDAQNWAASDLNRALVHELEHVRRGDWVVHCVARVVCAAYWFHPLVWMAWRRLALEAERACDDAVLNGSDATLYADQLVGLARRLSGNRKSPALAMANRSDLSARVGAVLDSRQRRGRAGKMLVAVVCAAAVVFVVTMSPLRMVASPQSAALPATGGKQLVFDAASIKPNTTGGEICTRVAFSCILDFGRPGRITIVNRPLREVIGAAYRLTSAQTRAISGTPKWMDSERFDIQATAEGNPDLEQKCLMLRSLLADRFGLAVHHETRQGPVYALVLAKAGKMGPGLVKHSGDAVCIDFSKPRPPSLGDSICGGFLVLSRAGVTHVTADNTNMAGVADQLGSGMPGGEIERPVVDRTGLSGSFDVTLEYTLGLRIDAGAAAPDPTAPPPLFTALQEQLGLKLESTKGPVEVLVIDHVEGPSEN
jgi:bla regulator protein blaR1